jgi:hypothetical protein
MSVDGARRNVERHLKEIARLHNEKSRQAGKVADANRRVSSASQDATRTTSPSVMNSKLRDAQRYQDVAIRAQKELAALEAKIAREQERLGNAQRDVAREEEREMRQRERDEEQKAREYQQRMQAIAGQLRRHDTLHRETMAAVEQLSQLPERIVVLFLASNPTDQVQLRLDEEARAISEMIRKSKHRDAVQFETEWAVRAADVLQAINEHQPRIVHFSGHGSNQDEVVLQDAGGRAKPVSKEAIVQAMRVGSEDIQLVFFNTCFSQAQAEAVVQHLPAAIGMTTSIGDEAARVFAAQFYSAIGFGLSVRKAFEQAKAAVMLEGIPEHDTPVLVVAPDVDADSLVLVRPPNGDAEAA